MITIRERDRIIVIGKTGTGKTYLVKKMLLPNFGSQSYVIWDPKRHFDPAGKQLLNGDLEELKKGKARPYLYRPSAVKRENFKEEFNDLCRVIYQRKNSVLIVDELSRVNSPGYITPYHDVIMREGRERNVGIVNLCQRPRQTHNTLLSEAEHFFIFWVRLSTDQKKIKQNLDITPEMLSDLNQHEFYYLNRDLNEPIKHQPI